MAGRPPAQSRQAIAQRQQAAAYSEGPAYPDPYAGGYTPYQPVPAVEDPAVVSARKTHRTGSVLYALSWIVIPAGFLMLVGGLALQIEAALGGSGAPPAPAYATDLMYAGLLALGAAMALRAIGLAMIWRADFTVKSRMVPDVPF